MRLEDQTAETARAPEGLKHLTDEQRDILWNTRQVKPTEQQALGAPWWIRKCLSYVGTEDATRRLGGMLSDWVRRVEAYFEIGYKT